MEKDDSAICLHVMLCLNWRTFFVVLQGGSSTYLLFKYFTLKQTWVIRTLKRLECHKYFHVLNLLSHVVC